ncbi:MAG: histidinol dehydrogenase [Archaeoglobaceae archaeon]|nr:histidinol dehydrogenase [Archaeoglobaceae archaeon]
MIVEVYEISRTKLNFEKHIEKVIEIIEEVKKRGDEALIEFTKKFDGIELESIKVEDYEIDDAYDEIDDETLDALEAAKENIEKFHMIASVDREIKVDFDGMILGKVYVPLNCVGIYIPGGKASYPSTALMAGIPANLAGVKKIVACTPPNQDGKVNSLTLVACDIAGIDEIYAVGGAQAIAAMAYGTETIPKVDKIVGPGNVYVTAAKIAVQKDVPIDMPAGPSEILVIADETANPRFVALDCAAQLEHDPLAFAAVLTPSKSFAEKVEREAAKLGCSDRLKIAIVSLDEAMDLANEIAPEHLSLVFDGCEDWIGKIRNAGSVFIGNYSAVAAGDYASGTNHILPTAGYAKVFSGLSVETFLKHFTYQTVTKDGLKKIGNAIIKLAKEEGLMMHAKSIEERLAD